MELDRDDVTASTVCSGHWVDHCKLEYPVALGDCVDSRNVLVLHVGIYTVLDAPRSTVTYLRRDDMVPRAAERHHS